MRAYGPYIPNLLSLSRIPLGIAFLLLYDTSSPAQFAAALSVAAAAFLTDVADGYLARRLGYANDMGALIDGLGDKAFYVAVYLVIAAAGAAPALLLWGLIFREVALYALRTVDTNRQVNTKRLRWASLTYAFVIRMYFVWFIVEGAYATTGIAVPDFVTYGSLLGYLALIFGLIGLGFLIHQMAEET